ncbi:hemerythrin domain-containing protein [Paramagnetospirillum magneticum]|uniref:hemerythrin domain-containing protein n=1 Tax=Paramagnetospirillum magneticum TaxID=84159 RepID=UPI00031FCCEF|nr:hemerythrin domain-containing protein [Paramagnetospirillum magneticum]
MRTLVWSEHFALGHERIDREHQRLLELSAQIEAKAETSISIEDVLPLCRDFFRLLVAHCFYEEQLLRKLPRDRFGAHVDEHCGGHARLIKQAQTVLTGQIPSGFESLPAFLGAYFELMHDLLVDDTELVGALIREGYHHPGAPGAETGWRGEIGVHPV